MTALEPIQRTPETRPGFIDQQSKDAIRHQLMLMADRANALAEADELDALAHGVVALTAIRRDLDTILKDASEAAARMIFRGVEGAGEYVEDRKKYAAPGLPVLEARTGTSRNAWESAELLGLIVDRFLAPDPETGEVPPPEAVTWCGDLICELVEVLPITTKGIGWRVRALKERGIDPDEYSTKKPGRLTVQLHGGDQ